MNSPFTMQELVFALDKVNTKSAPSKDTVTWNMLRNLPEEGKARLLETANEAWTHGEFPAVFRSSSYSQTGQASP